MVVHTGTSPLSPQTPILLRCRGTTGEGRWGCAPPPAFHTWLPPWLTYYLILSITNIAAPPLSKLPSYAPAGLYFYNRLLKCYLLSTFSTFLLVKKSVLVSSSRFSWTRYLWGLHRLQMVLMFFNSCATLHLPHPYSNPLSHFHLLTSSSVQL